MLTVERSILIPAPRAQVWHAISETPHIQQWWGANNYGRIAILQVGARIAFGASDDSPFATITVVAPPETFAFEWSPHPRYYSIPFVTRYYLSDEDGGTRVTLSESGFEALPDEVRQSRFERITQEFGMALENLKAYVEGAPLPFGQGGDAFK